MHGIVAYTFLNVCEKINSFRQTLKRCTQKKLVSFFCVTVYIGKLSAHMCLGCQVV